MTGEAHITLDESGQFVLLTVPATHWMEPKEVNRLIGELQKLNKQAIKNRKTA